MEMGGGGEKFRAAIVQRIGNRLQMVIRGLFSIFFFFFILKGDNQVGVENFLIVKRKKRQDFSRFGVKSVG